MSRRTFKLGLWSMVTEEFDAGLEASDKDEEAGPDQVNRNQVTTTPFSYTPLVGSQPRAIRLLRLLAGAREHDIECALDATTLAEAGRYEALSYVWGDGADTTPVQINGCTLPISINLRCALLNLRHEDRDRLLWVDAICIDQSSDHERDQQVAIMGDIYRQAYRVLVWLRDADPDATPKVMPLLAALADAALARAAKAGTSTSRDCMLDNIPNYMIERADVDDPLADKYRNDMTIMHLVASHWWYRAWTLQEILLAQDALVVIGTYTIEWWRFCAAVNHGFNIGIWAPLTMGVILDGMVLPYISVQHLQRRRARRHLQATNAAQELLEFLNSTRFRLATNPRDKIYALLGLVGNEGAGVALPELRPDYAMSVSYVYRQAAQQLILVSGTLDLVGSAGPIVDHTADPDLPSWVPDWRYTAMVCMPLMHDALGRRRTTHATRRSTVRDPFADAGRTLLLAGHEVTTITAVAPVLRRIVHRSDEFDDLVAGWEAEANAKRGRLSAVYLGVSILVQIFTIVYESLIALVPHLAIFSDWEAFASAANPTNPIPHNAVVDTEPSDPLAIYWQTLCVGTYVASSTFAQSAASLQDPAPATGADKTATQNLFYLWRATLKPIRDLHRWRVDRMFRPLAFLGYVRKTWRNYGEFTRLLEGAYERRLARGANGYLCLVPASAEVGDKIVLARGGRVPLVLRVGKEVDGAHSFIGEAYVHGIMDGDVWAEEKAVPIRVR